MENVFLTDGKGITSTSAQYLANIAKEEIKAAQSKLNNLSFVTKEVELINGTKKVLRKGKESIDLGGLLNKISNMHSFIAWIREAIKAKESLLEGVEKQKFDVEFPKPLVYESEVTEEDIISEMNIKERNNYFTLQAFASTYGGYIHPEGKISDAREDILFRDQLPCEVDGKGRDMVIYTYTPTISVSKIDNIYMQLQNKYRDYERKLNAIKYSIKEEVNKRNLEVKIRNQQLMVDYSFKRQKAKDELGIKIQNERERIAKLKIVIPEKLQDTFNYLESLGKEN